MGAAYLLPKTPDSTLRKESSKFGAEVMSVLFWYRIELRLPLRDESIYDIQVALSGDHHDPRSILC